MASDVEINGEYDEPEPEKSSNGTHKEAIHVANDIRIIILILKW